MSKSDYVYKNISDTKRVKIFKVYDDDSNKLAYWNVDIWSDLNTMTTFADCGDCFDTKRAAKHWAESQCGLLMSINNVETVTEGWKA